MIPAALSITHTITHTTSHTMPHIARVYSHYDRTRWIPTPDLPTMNVTCPKGMGNNTVYNPWEGAYAYPYAVCGAGNNTFVYPCCSLMEGETRVACGNIYCLTNVTLHDWTSCVRSVAESVNNSNFAMSHCDHAKEALPKPASAATGRAACAALVVAVFAGVAAAL